MWWNSCTTTPHCLRALGVELVKPTPAVPGARLHLISCRTQLCCMGEVVTATHAVHRRTSWGHWEVEQVHHSAALPRGRGRCTLHFLQHTSTIWAVGHRALGQLATDLP